MRVEGIKVRTTFLSLRDLSATLREVGHKFTADHITEIRLKFLSVQLKKETAQGWLDESRSLHE